MSETTNHRPTHLDPSELGTKEYWDNYYQNDLDLDDGDDDNDNDNPESSNTTTLDPTALESWFDDVNAPAKILEYLTSPTFPLSPNNSRNLTPNPKVLDLGTGNGSMLFTLRLEGNYTGPMTGVDYSQQSIDLATKLWRQFSSRPGSDQTATATATAIATTLEISFETIDLIHSDITKSPWWPSSGFDLVLDKGTFDAISLSSETIPLDDNTETQVRVCEVYPRRVASMLAPGGYLLVTSCNWTEEEVVRWFVDEERGELEVFGRIEYPIFEFGGQKGAGVASVCFRKR